MKKQLMIGLLSLLLLGCYDVVNQPVGGMGGEDAVFSIAGSWIEKAQKTQLTITKTEVTDEFLFDYWENNKHWQGMLEASYYQEKVVLNIDLTKTTINDRILLKQTEPMYLLIGGYFYKENFYLIPAEMNNFKKLMAKSFYATPISGMHVCLHELCKEHLLKQFVLAPANSKEFNRQLKNSYDKIFPKKNALIFEPKTDKTSE